MNGSFIEYSLTGDAASIRVAVQNALSEQEFRVTWLDEWSATAEQGSKGGNFLLGGIVKYLEIGIHITTAENGQIIVRVDSESSGHYVGSSALVGESIGNRQMAGGLAKLGDNLASAFTDGGLQFGVINT